MSSNLKSSPSDSMTEQDTPIFCRGSRLCPPHVNGTPNFFDLLPCLLKKEKKLKRFLIFQTSYNVSKDCTTVRMPEQKKRTVQMLNSVSKILSRKKKKQKFQLHICLRHQALRLLITMRLLITSLKLLLRELIYQLLLMVKANQLELFRRANCQDLRRLIRLQRHLPLIPRQFLSWVRSLPIVS